MWVDFYQALQLYLQYRHFRQQLIQLVVVHQNTKTISQGHNNTSKYNLGSVGTVREFSNALQL